MNRALLENERRSELSDFLRSRRARIAPADAGLASGIRRRTPGLRREEVALLANIGSTWYTRLEQGLPINVSAGVLDSIARALRLTHDERAHLYVLAGQRAPAAENDGGEVATDAHRRILHALEPNPAHILGRRWDVLAQNRASAAVLGDYANASGNDRNVVWRFFADPTRRVLFAEWDTLAPRVVAKFRAIAARYPDDESFAELVRELQVASGEFRRLWAHHDVSRELHGFKRYNHPIVGDLMLEYTTLTIPDSPQMRLMVYTPELGSESEHKLKQLVEYERNHA
jgi:transcriptional regulator with XRE-family HTH domain